MRYLIIFTFFILLFFYHFFSISTYAQVRINEIGIEQSPQSIEIINTSSESADISHWYLDDSGGTTYFTIPNNTLLYPFSCMIFTYDLNLNKSSPDTARLFDATAQPTSNSAHLIDSYSYKSSPGNLLTFSRVPDGADLWTTTDASFGLWNSTKENCIILPSPTPTPLPTPTTAPSPTLTPVNTPTSSPTISPISYPSTYNSVYISEVLVNPEKNNPEWIELYNDNDFSVSLHNWYIDDVENGGSLPKLFSLEIPAKQYGIFELTSSIFNNDGDNVRLLDSLKNEKDSFEYKETIQGKTIGRVSFNSDVYCLQEQSKGTQNNSCLESSSKLIATTNTISVNKSIVQQKTPTLASHAISSTYISPIPIINISISHKKEVLGEKIQININPSDVISFYQTPFYISFTYSLLTIFSLLIKIKNAFEININ